MLLREVAVGGRGGGGVAAVGIAVVGPVQTKLSSFLSARSVRALD